MRIPKSVSDHAMLEDRYYGHRQISEAIERMIMALFSCTQDSMAVLLKAPRPRRGMRRACHTLSRMPCIELVCLWR